MTVFQLLYECEKCGVSDAAPARIGAGTVATRLCPTCETKWGIYIRAQEVWLCLLETDRAERYATDGMIAVRAISDGLRYRREACNLALDWLGRDR